jgi:hypothetical protein
VLLHVAIASVYHPSKTTNLSSVMTPNLLVATQTLFSPHKWFKRQQSERPTRKTEHWDSPVPGHYEYIPGRGWYLVATDKDASSNVDLATDGGPVGTLPMKSTKSKDMIRMAQPVAVKYSKVLKRYLLDPDYRIRKRHGEIKDSRGRSVQVGFFRLDDGIAWVQCWDANGEFIPGPYKLWCVDAATEKFRHMLRKDDPDYAPSRANSRQNSFDRDPSTGRRSQDSRSTQYRASGPATPRDGPTAPSSRANSIRGLTPSVPSSQPGSQANSRANSRRVSPQRSHSLPLEEAKAALRAMAKAQAAAVQRSAGSEQSMSRGRLGPRVPSIASTASTAVN